MAKPDTAMVLAAGFGTRMQPLTNNRPKPMIKVCNKPLIDYTLDMLANAGLRQAIVNVHYLPEMIETHVLKRTHPQIIISDERGQILETGGGLKKARTYFNEKPIFCTNTDAIFINENGGNSCDTLANIWDGETMDALLLLVPIENTSGYDGQGDFDLDADGRIDFRANKTADYVFTGLQIIHPRLLDGVCETKFSTKILWDKAKSAGRLFGAVHSGYWLHVGDPEGLLLAEKIIQTRQSK